MRDMRSVAFIAVLAASMAPAWGQHVPHDFKQDTPPAPGQIVERPRDALRLAPLPLREAQLENSGLPTSGPMGLPREPRRERLYKPPAAR